MGSSDGTDDPTGDDDEARRRLGSDPSLPEGAEANRGDDDDQLLNSAHSEGDADRIWLGGSSEAQRGRGGDGGRRPALSDEVARKWDPSRLVKSVAKRAGSGQPLDATTRGRFERKLGVDLGGVRVYSGEFAEQVTKQHSAEAVTVGGTGMIMMSGTADRSPATASGQALLAHELTHVAQSSRGVYRSAPGERAPLATEEHEAEAEAAEAAELMEAGGGGVGEQREALEQSMEEVIEQVTSRVIELIYEDELTYGLRNGEGRWRP